MVNLCRLWQKSDSNGVHFPMHFANEIKETLYHRCLVRCLRHTESNTHILTLHTQKHKIILHFLYVAGLLDYVCGPGLTDAAEITAASHKV